MTDADFLWKLIIVASMLINCGAAIVSIIVSFKRRPPLTEEIYRDFVSKASCLALHERTDRETEALRTHTAGIHREIFDQLRAIKSAFENDLKAVERALGKLEGQINSRLGGR